MFELQTGDLSQPVKTQYGYHLIEVTDITPEKQLTYDQVKENIKSALLEEKQSETWQQWLDLAEAELVVEYRSGYKPHRPVRTSSSERIDHRLDRRVARRNGSGRSARRVGTPLRSDEPPARRSVPGIASRPRRASSPTPWRRPTSWPTPSTSGRRTAIRRFAASWAIFSSRCTSWPAWPRSRGSTTWATWLRAFTPSWSAGIPTSSETRAPTHLNRCARTGTPSSGTQREERAFFTISPTPFPPRFWPRSCSSGRRRWVSIGSMPTRSWPR